MDCSWNLVVANLRKYGIDVSGGSVVKRHLMNPMDYTLSLFITKVLGVKMSYKQMVYSNHFLEKNIYQSNISAIDVDKLGSGLAFSFQISFLKTLYLIMEYVYSVENENFRFLKGMVEDILSTNPMKEKGGNEENNNKENKANKANIKILLDLRNFILNEIIFKQLNLDEFNENLNKISIANYANKLNSFINSKYGSIKKDGSKKNLIQPHLSNKK